MKEEQIFKNGWLQGELSEVESVLRFVNGLKTATEIWDLKQAYDLILDKLILRKADLMNKLNWKEPRE